MSLPGTGSGDLSPAGPGRRAKGALPLDPTKGSREGVLRTGPLESSTWSF